MPRKIEAAPLCVFDPTDDIRPRCGFRRKDSAVVYAGVLQTNSASQEASWGHDTTGRWIGGPPFMEFPRDMRILGAPTSRQGPAGNDGIGVDVVYHVTPDEPFSFTWDRSHAQGFGPPVITPNDGNQARWHLVDCSDGVILTAGFSSILPLSLPGLPAGSYAMFAQFDGIKPEMILPEDEDFERDPVYDYEEEGEWFHYNPYWHVGRVPLDPGHELRVLRREILDKNQQQDREEWIKFCINPTLQSGEWSGIKIVAGDGMWSVAPGVQITPYAALMWLDFEAPTTLSPSTPRPIVFDPMARQVTLPLETSDGRLLIGGSRTSASGAAMALWELHNTETPGEETATLLGLDFSSPRPISECYMEEHSVTGLVELDNGDIILSNLCATYRYEPGAWSIDTSLPRWPWWASGEPGGRCLVHSGDRIKLFTEAFGVQPDPESLTFYNVLLEYFGRIRLLGAGTAFHGESCAVRHRGKVYGVRQDKPFSDPTAKQAISWHDGTWDKTSTATFDAAHVRLQRLGSANGVLYTQGYVEGEETAIIIESDGRFHERCEFDYRLRQIVTTHSTARAGYQSLIAVGREVLGPASLDDKWALVEFGGPLDLPGEPPLPPGEEYWPPEVGEVLHRFAQVETFDPFYAVEIIDGDTWNNDGSKGALAKFDYDTRFDPADPRSGVTVWGRLDSEEDPLDLSTYTIRLGYGRRLNLPHGTRLLDVVFFVPSTLYRVQLPSIIPCD